MGKTIKMVIPSGTNKLKYEKELASGVNLADLPEINDELFYLAMWYKAPIDLDKLEEKGFKPSLKGQTLYSYIYSDCSKFKDARYYETLQMISCVNMENVKDAPTPFTKYFIHQCRNLDEKFLDDAVTNLHYLICALDRFTSVNYKLPIECEAIGAIRDERKPLYKSELAQTIYNIIHNDFTKVKPEYKEIYDNPKLIFTPSGDNYEELKYIAVLKNPDMVFDIENDKSNGLYKFAYTLKPQLLEEYSNRDLAFVCGLMDTRICEKYWEEFTEEQRLYLVSRHYNWAIESADYMTHEELIIALLQDTTNYYKIRKLDGNGDFLLAVSIYDEKEFIKIMGELCLDFDEVPKFIYWLNSFDSCKNINDYVNKFINY